MRLFVYNIMVKEQKISTSGFILKPDGKFLIVKRAKNDNFLPDQWELPGGKLEFGEDATDGAKREIKEETGLEVIADIPLTILTYIVVETDKSERHYVEIVYLAHLNDASQEIKLSDEHQDYQWITFEELPKTQVSYMMLDTIKKLKNHPLLHT